MTDRKETLFDGFPVSKGGATRSPRIALYSQARILRNLDGRLFPGRAEASELSGVRGDLWRAARNLDAFEHGWAFEAERTRAADAKALVDSGYVDEGWASLPMAGVMVTAIRDMSLTANTNDHLSLNVFRPGTAIRETVAVAEETVQNLAGGLAFSRHPQVGYLTTELRDAGLGLRIATALHLPVLRLSGRIRPIVRGLQSLGFFVTNSSGRMGKLEDDVVKLWCTCDLEESLADTASMLERESDRLRQFELDAREQMLGMASEDVFDRVGRCYGLLCQAHRLSALDMQRFLSGMRLGIDIGMFSGLDHAVIDRLENDCSEARLSGDASGGANPRSIEIARATRIKRALELLR